MATRQYIGARYVPKFFEGVGGSNEWVSGVQYEPLTIVTHLGNSYTSKKPVPVGIDILNTEYWVNTGNYNAQVEEYRQEVASKSPYKPRVILVGDSYGESPTLNESWEKFAQDYLTSKGVDCYRCNISGGSFGNNVKFLTALQNITGVVDTNGISDIIVCGGYNDINMIDTDIYAGMYAFSIYVNNIYPNAKIHIGMVGFASDGASRLKLHDVVGYYRNACEVSGCNFIEGSQYVLRRYDQIGTDGIHPNIWGSIPIGRSMANYVITHTVIPADEFAITNNSFNAHWGITVEPGNFGLTWAECLNGDNLLINSNGGTIAFSEQTIPNLSLASYFTPICLKGVGTLNDMNTRTKFSVTCTATTANDEVITVNAIFILIDNFVYLTVNSPVSLKSITVPPFSVMLPTIYC